MLPGGVPSLRFFFVASLCLRLASSAMIPHRALPFDSSAAVLTPTTDFILTSTIAQRLELYPRGEEENDSDAVASIGTVFGPSPSVESVPSIATETSASGSPSSTSAERAENKTIPIAVSVSIVCVILIIIGLVILRLRRLTSVRNSEGQANQGPEAKNLPTRFDLESPDIGSESGVNRTSWAPYINRLETQQALTPSNTISTRQVYISNQVNRAREKVAELEAEKSTLLRQSSHSSESHQEGIPSGTGDVPADDLNSSGIYETLERAIRQIEGLNDRIRELEGERRSSWALGLSDEEAPPGYIE
ncbi:hypothetical protein C8F04DRAFT_1067740 [Mycena alexandri]|uniref:Uncharacterized protein n=1 Tax=Mycena alexandri TaxID=1745969 RepID=A0AAD6XH62_9AGAR|nr:hypothetical protein C8F04DRAFT_1067740 [Mycena alexandri]